MGTLGRLDGEPGESYIVKTIASTIPNLVRLAVFSDEIQHSGMHEGHILAFNSLEEVIVVPTTLFLRMPVAIESCELGSANCPPLTDRQSSDFHDFQATLSKLEKEQVGWKAPMLRIARRIS